MAANGGVRVSAIFGGEAEEVVIEKTKSGVGCGIKRGLRLWCRGGGGVPRGGWQDVVKKTSIRLFFDYFYNSDYFYVIQYILSRWFLVVIDDSERQEAGGKGKFPGCCENYRRLCWWGGAGRGVVEGSVACTCLSYTKSRSSMGLRLTRACPV